MPFPSPPGIYTLAGLHGWPAHSSANASLPSSGMPTHGSERCGSLCLHRSGLSPPAPCRSSGAPNTGSRTIARARPRPTDRRRAANTAALRLSAANWPVGPGAARYSRSSPCPTAPSRTDGKADHGCFKLVGSRSGWRNNLPLSPASSDPSIPRQDWQVSHPNMPALCNSHNTVSSSQPSRICLPGEFRADLLALNKLF